MTQKIIFILITFISVISYGQVSISLKPDKSDYNAKEIVNLTIVLELNGDNLSQQSPIKLPDLSQFNIIGSGSVNNAVIDPETQISISQSVTRIALEPKQKGKIRIGSVLVTVNNKIYKTEPFNIFIRDIEKKSVAAHTSHDLYLNMEIDDREVYQDQPTLAVLRVYSKNIDNLRRVKNIHLPEQDNINIHPVTFKRSDIDPTGYGNMPSQILAVFMIFPNEAGSIEIPSVSASVNSFSHKNKILSNKVKLNVKKLPEGAPGSFRNAVGKFRMSVYKASKEKVEAKKPLHVIVKVSGEGNLADLQLPKIEPSEDYELFAPKVTSRVAPGKVGIKGEITASYVLIPNKSGDLKIRTEEFAYFNPAEKEYINLGKKVLHLNAFSHDEVLEARSTVEKVNEYTNTFLETVDSPVLKTTTFKVKEKDKAKFNWSTLLLNIAVLSVLSVLYLMFKKWQKNKALVKENVNHKHDLGSVAETEKLIRKNLKTDITAYFSYLKTLKNSGDYQKFFLTVDEMDAEIRKEYFQGTDEDFKAVLEKSKGNTVAELYRKVSEKIQIEKYTPVKSDEGISELLNDIIILYTQISK